MTRKAVVYSASIVMFLAFLMHPLISVGQVEIQLSQGWNLVSLPVEPDSDTIPYIPLSILQQCRAIWTYNAFSGMWEYYIAGENLVTLTTIKPFRGYWIDMSEDATLTITGTEICNRAVYLWEGWNLVGYGCSTGQLIEENSFSVTGVNHSIWAYESDHWLVYTPDDPSFVDKLEYLDPGIGYWIHVEEDCLWDPFLNSLRVYNITPEEAFDLIQDNEGDPDFVILDVRTPGEFASGYIQNAINMDYYSASFEEDLDKLDKNKTYLVYCGSGFRSADALSIMEALNYVEVYDMLGGILAWKDLGFPITSD
jgi:rhodanese-related sulfurtransferase